MAENRADLIKQLEQSYEDMGVPVDSVKTEIADEQNERLKQWNEKKKENLERSLAASRASNINVGLQTGLADVAMGIGTSFIDINRNISNGIIGVVDAVDNTLQDMGLTKDDLVTDKAYFKDLNLQEKAQMGDAGKVAHAMYKVAAPMALGAVAIPAAPISGGLAIDAAYNFFAADPNGGRLSDVLKDTWVENVPMAGALIDTLSTKPDDTELQGRIKNVAEGFGLGSSLAMLFNIGRARTGYNKLKSLFVKEGGVVPPDVPPATPPAAVEGIPAVTDEALEASDAAISTPAASERVKLFSANIQKYLANGGQVDEIYEDVARFKQGLPPEEHAAFDAAIFGDAKGKQGRLKLAVDDFNKFEAAQAKETAHMAQVMEVDKPLVEVTDSPSYINSQPTTVSRKGLSATDETVKVAQADLDKMNVQVRKKDMKAAKDGSVELTVFIDKNGERFVGVAGKAAIREAEFLPSLRGNKPSASLPAQVPDNIPNAAGPNAVVRPRVAVNTPAPAVTQVANAVAAKEIDLLKPYGAKEYVAAGEIITANPEKLSQALEGKIIGKEKEHLIKWYVQKIDENLFDLAGYVSNNPEDLAAAARLTEMLKTQGKLAEALDSVGNKTFMASPTTGEFLSEFTGQSQKKNLENLGRAGRAQLVKQLVDGAGGSEAVQVTAQSATTLKQLEAIKNIKDSDFTQTLNGVRLRSRWRQYTYALNQSLVSSLLSVTGAVRIGLLNTGVLAGETTARYVKAAIGFNKQGFKEANMFTQGAFEGIRAAAPKTWQQIKGGEVVINGKTFTSAYSNLEFMPALPDDTAASLFGKTMSKVDRFVGSPLMAGLEKVTGFIPNVYGAFDNPHKYGIYTGNMRVLGLRLGNQLKLEGDTLSKFIDDFAVGRIGADNMTSPAVLNQWKKADEIATREAGIATGSAELQGFFRATADANRQFMETVPVLGTVFPFLRATVNQITNDLRYTPVQLGKTAYDVATAAENGDKDALLQISRIAVGSVMMASIYQLIQSGYIKGDSTDWGTTNALRTAKAPNGAAIKFGDKWVDVSRIGIVSNMINGMAHISRASGYVGEDEYRQMSYGFLNAFMEILSPQILLETMGTLLDITSGDITPDAIESFAARSLANRTPGLNITSTFTGMFDDTARSTTGDDFTSKLRGYLTAKVPQLSKDMRPVLNYWGEEVRVPDGLGMNVDLLAGEDADTRRLQDKLTSFIEFNDTHKQYSSGLLSIDVPLAPKAVKNMAYEENKEFNPALKDSINEPLTVDEQWNYQKIAGGIDPTTGGIISPEGYEGKTLKMAVSAVLDKYQAWDKEPWQFESAQYAMMLIEISQAQQAFREQALNAINNNPIIRKRMEDGAAKFGAVGAQVEAAGGLNVGQ